MSNVFSNAKILIGSWTVVEERPLSDKELAQILFVEKVPSQYGYSAKFTIATNDVVGAEYQSVPLARDAEDFEILGAIDARKHLSVMMLQSNSDDNDLIYRINVKF